MIGKPLPFSYRSRSHSRDNRDTSRHRSPNTSSFTNSKLVMEIIILNHQVVRFTLHKTTKFSEKRKLKNHKNNYSNNSSPQSLKYNRDSNRSRQPFLRNLLRNVRTYKNLLLDPEQTDDTASTTEHMETQTVSEELLQEQQLNDSLLEFNQDRQDGNFDCQEAYKTLTEEYIFST